MVACPEQVGEIFSQGIVSDELIVAAEAFVKKALSNTDASHDFFHIQRVRANAKAVATGEGLSEEQSKLLDLAALLHDVADWKYSKDEHAQQKSVQSFLETQRCPDDVMKQVLSVIMTVGFKDELPKEGTASNGVSGKPSMSIVAKVLQDADRLDAIGAIGIARCLTFGGAFNRELYDPAKPPRVGLTKAEYMGSPEKNTTLNHFYEKLLLLKDMMKTATGRQMAQGRHDYTAQFLDQFHAEWLGAR